MVKRNSGQGYLLKKLIIMRFIKRTQSKKQLTILKNDAKVQAAMLQKQNDEIELFEGAQEQAELLNRVNLLLDGAQKQAELLIKQEKENTQVKE